MKRTLNAKEKTLIFIKRTKKKNLKYTGIILPILLIALVITTWMGRAEEVKTVATKSDQPLTMTMVGDVMMGRYVEEVTEKHGYEYLFRYMKPYFANSDYVSGNYEHTALKEEVSNYKGADTPIRLNSNTSGVEAVKDAGFSVVSLANNHMMDYEEQGLLDTIDEFKSADMHYVGVGSNTAEAKNSIDYADVNGVRVATLGFTDVYGKDAVSKSNKAGLLNSNPDLLFEMIGKARDAKQGNADLVVVNMHWGQEYSTSTTDRQKDLAKAIIDAGADIIIGHHPHVLQSFDVYKDGIIFYSLGNFIFDQGWTRTKDSAMVQYHLANDGKATIDVVPLQIEEATPRPATSSIDKSRVYRQLTKETSEKVQWSKKEDRIEITLDHKKVIDHKAQREQEEKAAMEKKAALEKKAAQEKKAVQAKQPGIQPIQ
ncbi:capsular biosynthesis protein [Bacillus sp. Soil745]|jgi:poly-gamma-glutamate synthesis protein (capsule biosynthesis protein)|uniref:CapA family protein n=1 Tax=Peribacillus frigoritolerans TaxID=450367 RepID=UPI00070FC1AF|nr:CapA family protein [Peribacillus frigoritolerans]KRF54640.1 capsular biosynthesis protein [Bacillus sp. Soil745]MBD8134571.1 CapA family protein [Bacillus sp. CFBP 13597]PAW28713.1 capsular biosynthesis protein [Peribacillus simplex]PEF37077.1 capsular biosynthesis protein [Bacillus sp. AFS094228]MCR8869570.1 CapA family protein [Peribacillus frigoritolerans]